MNASLENDLVYPLKAVEIQSTLALCYEHYEELLRLTLKMKAAQQYRQGDDVEGYHLQPPHCLITNKLSSTHFLPA